MAEISRPCLPWSVSTAADSSASYPPDARCSADVASDICAVPSLQPVLVGPSTFQHQNSGTQLPSIYISTERTTVVQTRQFPLHSSRDLSPTVLGSSWEKLVAVAPSTTAVGTWSSTSTHDKFRECSLLVATHNNNTSTILHNLPITTVHSKFFSVVDRSDVNKILSGCSVDDTDTHIL
jgi:hypothetical protein